MVLLGGEDQSFVAKTIDLSFNKLDYLGSFYFIH
jgi:hypothetical protein